MKPRLRPAKKPRLRTKSLRKMDDEIIYVNFSGEQSPPRTPEKTEYPPSDYPEFNQLPTEALIETLESIFVSVPRLLEELKNSKEAYLRDKSNGFQFVSESYYRDLFRLDSFAPFLFRDDKIDLSIPDFIGCVRDSEEEYVSEEEEEEEEYYYDKEKVIVGDQDWLVTLLGKQFLLKFMELGKIEADESKESVIKADWALYCNNGLMTDSLFFLNRRINPYTT